ncbi:MAG: sulfur carrier protein ThiS [Gemmatimonadota bacterium]|nr:sulfur carrier protein ThiS [Gemmatimonadota bacterium]
MSDDTTTIPVRVNGTERAVPAGLSVHQLLEHFELVPGTVVVERNKRILRREDYPAEPVERGDELELVHFVGGG